MRTQKGIVPPTAEQPNVLHGLVRKHAEISGKIGQLKTALHDLTAELAHIDAAILIFDPSVDIGTIRARSTAMTHPAFPGEITRIVIDVLRDADRPMTPREITLCLANARGLNPEDRALFDVLLKRVRSCLRFQRQRGTVQSTTTGTASRAWEVVP